MTPKTKENLHRLLSPRHVAVIGGRDAEIAASGCARIGFAGPLWPVNPKRATIAGVKCFASVEDLPEPPDATFLAIPCDATIDSVARLNALGAGGVVCYAAGFAETGEDGAAREQALIDAAGDMALIGPNCYGVINYVDRAALWPFAHGGSFPGFGAAIIAQSGMLSSDLTMSQRSVPFAYMISVGNQSGVQFDALIDALCEKPEVRAIGLHIEGIKDIPRFADAALKSIRAGVPIAALKSGASKIGAQLTVSHTGSLSGAEELYRALFEKLGVIRVDTPAQLLETLKFLCICGAPKGDRVAGFTCSGGGATFLADHGDALGLNFPQPSKGAGPLRERLPYIAKVINPLDYTTPIWGQPDRVRPVFDAMFLDEYDAAVLVQDYPLAGLDESKESYLNDARSFVAATRAVGLPAAVCSTLPENIDAATRDMLVESGVAPLQGVREALAALAGAGAYARRRRAILASQPRFIEPATIGGDVRALDEWEGKQRLNMCGITTPQGVVATAQDAPAAASGLGFPVALKMIGADLPHKTEVGAVTLNLASRAAVAEAATVMLATVAGNRPHAATDRFLVERMIGVPTAELLVNARNDAAFGPVMTIATGGVFVELLHDAVTLLLPVDREELRSALGRIKAARLIGGFRGGRPADRAAVVETLLRIADLAVYGAGDIAEIEINPLMIVPDGVFAADVLMRVASD